MATTAYTTYINFLMTGGSVDLENDDIRTILVDMAQYPLFDIDTDEFLEDIPSAARISVSPLVNAVVTGRVLDADDTVHSNVSGANFEAIVFYKHEAVDTETTSRLLAYNDSIPQTTPNGEDLTLRWSDDVEKIWRF